jgi:Mn-containing catalase
MPVDSDEAPFDMLRIYASGNIAADMTANVTAESMVACSPCAFST